LFYNKGENLGKSNFEKLDDFTLLKEYLKSNDDKLFEELYKRYNKRIYNYMKFILQYIPEDLVMDLTDEVFINAYIGLKRLTDLKSNFSFKSWLYRIAHNVSINYLKSHKEFHQISESILDTKTDVEEKIIKDETREFILKEINKFEPVTREAILLKFYHNLTYDEIAEILDVSVRKVKYKVKDGLIILGEKLKKAGYY